MDIALYLRVIWRFRYVVLAGLLLALGLAFLSFARVSAGGISYRQQETYSATEVALLTTRSSLFDASQQANIAQLATQYVQIANGDVVRERVRNGGPMRGSYEVSQLFGPNGSLQPAISITGFAHTPKPAVSIADRVSEALSWWIEQSQAQQNVPPRLRVAIESISQPRPVLAEGRRLTAPMVIFLGVLTATLGLVFILENLMPRAQEPRPRKLTPAIAAEADSAAPQSVVSSDAEPSAIILPSSIATRDGGQNGSTSEEAPPADSLPPVRRVGE